MIMNRNEFHLWIDYSVLAVALKGVNLGTYLNHLQLQLRTALPLSTCKFLARMSNLNI
jgi:hypothetical protein